MVSQNVSRETIVDPAQKNNLVFKNISDYLNGKFAEARQGDSQASTSEQGNTQHQFQNSMSFSSLMSKSALAKDVDPQILKGQLQQQFDALMQRARVIIKDRENANLTAQLYPKELGKVSLRLALTEGSLHGKFLVENEIVQKELMGKT